MNGKTIENWERKFISDNYISMSDIEISEHLKRSDLTISVLRAKMGLLRAGSPKPFSNDEKAFIRNNYQHMSNNDIGIHLKRSSASISNYIVRNKFKRLAKKQPENSIYIEKKVAKMKELIYICENTLSPYRKDQAMKELKKLSGL